jgi:phosphatidylglycerol:prolipoprotein diacylglycerol transferase
MGFHLAAILHRIDPFAIHFGGQWGIRWYGLSYLAGFACAYLFIGYLARRGRSSLGRGEAADFVVAAAIGTVVGGRLGYCVFYQPNLLIDFSGAFPFWGVLRLWEGGMASHGGMIGIIVACLIYARRRGHDPLHLFDLSTIGGTIGIFFGRLANFVNGELLGRPAPADLPWAVKFPHEVSPEQLHSQAFAPITEQVRELARTGQVTGPTLYDQFLDAVQSNEAVAAMVRPLLTPRHPSQLYEALGEGLLLFVVLLAIWYRPRKPGVVGGWFLVCYAVVRIIGEQFRLPDAHIADQEFAWLGITRGQWLSGVMLLVGMVLLIWWSRRKVRRISGWGPALGASDGQKPQ